MAFFIGEERAISFFKKRGGGVMKSLRFL